MPSKDKRTEIESKVGAGEAKWVGEMIDAYGHEILDLIARALKEGMSKDLIQDVLMWGGPIVFQILMMMADDPKVGKKHFDQKGEGEEPKLELPSAAIKKIAEMMILNYKDDIIKWIFGWLEK